MSSAYQAPSPRREWLRGPDGVPELYVDHDAAEERRFDLDEQLGADEYISTVSWSTEGPVITGENFGKNAKGTITFTGIPTTTETMVLGDTTITALTAPTGIDEFAVGANAAAAGANFAEAVNDGSELELVEATDNEDGTVTLAAKDYGTDGNDIVLTESLSNCTVDGSGTLGATQAGTTVGGIDGKSHVATFTGSGDAEVTVTTTDSRTIKQRFRWIPIDKAFTRDRYR